MFKKLVVLSIVLCIATARDYKKYPSMDCINNDIRQEKTNDPEELMKICDATEECVGFNTHGWLKKKCPNFQVEQSVDTYLIDSIHVPTGKEPDVLLWPMPKKYDSGEIDIAVDVHNLKFTTNIPSEEVEKAIFRMKKTVFIHQSMTVPSPAIREVNIYMKSGNPNFKIFDDESYTLNVPSDGSAVEITAATVAGVYHALNSFSFLIQYNAALETYVVKHAPIMIEDTPFLKYRSLMIDSARHYLPLPTIKRIVDAMSWVKLNVLHWHLVDDESFPVYIPSVPELWKGSFTPYERYTHWDVEEIVEYAKERGVHVVPETDVPGHSTAWCTGVPEMCPSDTCKNPLDPTKDLTFNVIDRILNDFIGSDVNEGLFPGEFMHIGGDEVDVSCWNKVDHVKEWMAQRNYTAKDAYGYFVNTVDGMIRKRNHQTIAWEEVFNNHKDIISKDMIIQIWLGDGEGLKNVVGAGHRAIVSNYKHWYLPQLWETWDYYYLNPFLDGIPKEQWDLIIGGEVCMWSEYVDASDFENTIMPRAIAAAERMWTQPELLNVDEASERLPYIRCVFNHRGIQASPTFGEGRSAPAGPGSCMKQ